MTDLSIPCPSWCDWQPAHRSLRITGGPPALHESRVTKLPATDTSGAVQWVTVRLIRQDDSDGAGRVSVLLIAPADPMLPSEAGDLGRALVRLSTLGLPDDPMYGDGG